MQEMVNFAETEAVFFDAVNNHLVAEEDSTADRVLVGGEFWRSELRSVKERRESFWREMDLLEDLCPSFEHASDNSLGMESERLEERSNGAVLSSCSSSSIDHEDPSIEFCARECNGNANSVVDEGKDDTQRSPSMCLGEKHRVIESINKRLGQWWKEIVRKRRTCKCEVEKRDQPKKPEMSRMKTWVRKKKFKEFSATFTSQEIRGHKGIIRTMKFSPDGKYLASGGQDGIVKVWCVTSIDSCLESLQNESEFGKEKKVKAQVVIPDKVFKIEERPLHEFHGHVGDILNLAWSSSNRLLSASMDRTVRLWEIGSDECLSICHHTSYVTCVQFNPMDDHSFISGSIDGKVRVWGVLSGRVLDWSDVGDAVTAVCYQPDGRGFVVGSLGGTCRLYEAKGGLLEPTADILVHSNRKSSTNRITGIQFSQKGSEKLLVTFEDSKLRIFDKMDVTCKYRGLSKSGSQMSASFTSNGRHIISIGEDSRVYIWNNEHPFVSSSSPKKSVHSCEHFSVQGVSVALPWPGSNEPRLKGSDSHNSSMHEATSQIHHPPSFFVGNLFSSRSSATWPEDMLPVFNPLQSEGQGPQRAVLPPSWGLVVVTGNSDGMIQTFHNYGLPVVV